jgi:hypothetical protein
MSSSKELYTRVIHTLSLLFLSALAMDPKAINSFSADQRAGALGRDGHLRFWAGSGRTWPTE